MEILSQALDTIEHMFESDNVSFEAIPPGLDSTEPGPALACFLASIDVDAVSGYERVVVLKAHQRMASHYQAQMYTDIVAVAEALHDDPEWPLETATATEVRAALQLTRRAADIEVGSSWNCTIACPGWGRPWRLETSMCGGPARSRLALAISPTTTAAGSLTRSSIRPRGWTTGQLAARIRNLCIQVDPTVPDGATTGR